MKTMSPIDAEKCEFYADKRPNVPYSYKPSKTLLESVADKEEYKCQGQRKMANF